MNIMFLNGAGGTGKSSILREIEALRQKNGKLLVHTLYSSTRESYAQLGISNETSSIDMDDETRIRLQLTIMDNERAAIRKKVEEIRGREGYMGYDLLVVDRGPMDRMAYYLLTMMQCSKGACAPFFDMLRRNAQFIKELAPGHVIQIDFTYPVHWDTKDGFRQENEFQTLALSLMTSNILQRYAAGTGYKTAFWYDHDFATHKGAEQKAKAIMERYTHLWPFGPDYSWV
jgi:hypothetical protein